LKEVTRIVKYYNLKLLFILYTQYIQIENSYLLTLNSMALLTFFINHSNMLISCSRNRYIYYYY